MNLKESDGRELRLAPCAQLPELRIVGRTEINRALPQLEIPFDRDSINIYVGYKGSKQMQAAGKVFSMKAGEFFLTPPGIDHSTGPMPVSKCAHYWIRINLRSPAKTFMGDPQANMLRNELLKTPLMVAKASAHCLEEAKILFELASETPSSARDFKLRLHFGLFIMEILECSKKVEFKGDEIICKVYDYLSSHLDEDVSVADMARIASCSVSKIQDDFRKHEGLTPAECFMRLKMEEASRRLISSVCTAKEISRQLGFANERYFSTAFRRYFSMPPGTYRKQQHNS